MNTVLIIILAVIGVLLLLAEIFLIPGGGAVGIAGILCLGGATFGAYYWISPLAGHITLGLSLLFGACCIYAFFKSRALEKMALKTDIDSKVDLIDNLGINIGDRGTTLGRLAPMGHIIINDNDVEAKSWRDFIDENIEVEVIAIEGNHVVVKPL